MSKKKRTTKDTVEEIKEAAITGRPSSYRDEYPEQAAKLCRLGATDADLADFFNVGLATVKRWSSKHPEFRAALKAGKEEADDRVERSLYQKAVGYEYDAVKIFNANGSPMVVPYREVMPPDTTAMIFWLKNRRSDRWRDVHKHEHGAPNAFDKMSDDELHAQAAEMAEKLKLTHPGRISANGSGTKH